MFNNFGSEVTVLDGAETFLARLDRDVADTVAETLRGQGITIVHGARAERIVDRKGCVRVEWGDEKLEADAVLMAAGRTPATAALDLEAAGIETDERGYIKVDDHLRTNVEGVFAVGDVNGGPQFTYISYDDYRIVADQLMGDGERNRADRVAVPTTTFLTPPLSQVGMGEDEARAAGHDVLIAKAKVADIAVMPRPKIVGDPAGLVKFVVDAADQTILGATLYCIDSQELINMVALAIRMGATVADLRDGIWTHPSSTEAFNGVFANLG